MEYCDVYDSDGIKTGKVAVRGAWKRNRGEYLLSVHVLIRNRKNEYLIQKRSEKKKSFPGVWNLTCGMVDAGETGISAVKREIKEEIGIDIDGEKVIYGGRIALRALFADIFLVEKDFSVSDCILQKDEVSEVRWVDEETLLEMIRSAPSRTKAYDDLVEKLIKENK